MGRSVRSKRGKALRTVKREALNDVEQLKVKVLNAKLTRYLNEQQLDEQDIKPEQRMPIERDPIEFALDPTSRFSHSHPKPRDPADPTIRPFPRGRPGGRDRSVRRATAATDENAEDTADSAASGGDATGLTFAQALARQQAMTVDGIDDAGTTTSTDADAAVKIEGAENYDSMFDGEVSYVSMGAGNRARVKSGKQREQRRTRSVSKKRGPVAAILRSWHQIKHASHK